MTKQIEIGYDRATAFHVGSDAYTVEVCIGGGMFAYHVGPVAFPYFTKEQAEKLAAKVSAAGHITLAMWVDGYRKPLRASQVSPRPPLTFA